MLVYYDRTSLDPAATALLDHIAEDIAREYVRLMDCAAQANVEIEPREAAVVLRIFDAYAGGWTLWSM